MRQLLPLLLFLVLSLQLSAKSIIIDGKTYSVDTLSNFQAGPGVQHLSLRLMSDTRLDVYFLKVDTSNPYVSFKAALGRDSIYGGERPSAVAARKSTTGNVYFAGTNADFYNVADYVGYPLGGCVVNSEVAKVPSTDRRVIAFEENKIPSIGGMTYSGIVKSGTSIWALHGVNHLRGANQLILYNQHNGKITRTNTSGTEVQVQLSEGSTWGISKSIFAKVIKTEKEKGGMAIPKGYAVLSGNGSAATQLNTLSVGDEVEIKMNIEIDGRYFNPTDMVGGDNRNPMLYNGKVETAQVWNELHPRTAIGYSADKQTIIFCVVDGRGLSVGVTTKQLAQLMISAGAYTAFNMDGGGSSCMYIKELGPVNKFSDPTERAVGNSLFVVSSSPASTTISQIQASNPTIRISPNGSYKPVFHGYNQYGMLVTKNLSNVQLSCSPSVGTIQSGGTFNATGNENGIVTATYNGINTQLRVVLISNEKSQVERVSEDFSTPEWDNEFKRLNPSYTTLTAGKSFGDMNTVELYHEKYAFEGAIVGESNNPNCVVPGMSHGDQYSAIGFRFRNSGNSIMEFPEMKSAGTMTIHVLNGNATLPTTLSLQELINGSWENVYTFNLTGKNDYIAGSIDEVLSININSEKPIKLRLSRGDKFVTLFRVDITPYGETAVNNPLVMSLKVIGRQLIVSEPGNVSIYNTLGMKVFEGYVEKEILLPPSISNGMFIVRTKGITQKIHISKL